MSFLRRTSDSHATTAVFPTFLQPSLAFRRKSRQSSTDSTTSTSSNFSVFSQASATSTTSSNPFSRCPTPVPIPAQDDIHLEPPTDKFLHGQASHIACAKCSTHLALTSQIISKGFTGRHGRAFLVQGGRLPGKGIHDPNPNLPNTYLSKAVPRHLVTGAHTVSDIFCALCGSLLGWKYVEASEESQKYKVGKFILETRKVRTIVNWEEEEQPAQDQSGWDDMIPLGANELRKLDARDGVLAPEAFDSQDEDECEDLFAGVWSPQLAAKRRQRKKERQNRSKPKPVFQWNRSSQDSLV